MSWRGWICAFLVVAGCHAGEDVPPVPAEYEGRVNPLPDEATVVERGRQIFQRTCAPCHGPGADGKGVAATGLTPPPANFHDPARLAGKGDDYVFWRISTGIPETAMPAFGATLSEEDRWAILRFLRQVPKEDHGTSR